MYFILSTPFRRRPIQVFWIPFQRPMAVCRSNMSTHICRLLELASRASCCLDITSQSCLRRTMLVAPRVPWIPMFHRRTYSLDSLSPGPGRPTLGANSQQSHAERVSPSSALAHRNLSAVAMKVDSYLFPNFDFFLQCSLCRSGLAL